MQLLSALGECMQAIQRAQSLSLSAHPGKLWWESMIVWAQKHMESKRAFWTWAWANTLVLPSFSDVGLHKIFANRTDLIENNVDFSDFHSSQFRSWISRSCIRPTSTMIISGDHVCFDFKIYCRGIGSGALIPVHSKCTEVGVWSLMTGNLLDVPADFLCNSYVLELQNDKK